MGYLFIVIAVLCGAVKGFFGKRTSAFTATSKAAVSFSTVRMSLVVLAGLIFVVMEGDLASIRWDVPTLLISGLAGLSNALMVVSWLFCVRNGAFMMVDAVQTAAITLLPTVVSALLFGELPGINDIVGIALLIAAAVVMCAYSGKIKGKLTLSSLGLLLLCGLSAGGLNLCQKLFNQYCPGQRASVYNLASYVVSALLLLLVYLTVFLPRKEQEAVPEKEGKSPWKTLVFYALVMGVCMFGNTFFSTLAAGELPAAKTYPVMQGMNTICSVSMSAVFFKEKVTPSCMIGVGMNFAALMIINLL